MEVGVSFWFHDYDHDVYYILKDLQNMKWCFSAADGCLQYFTGVSGMMMSFNYNNAAGLQLSNTDYTMCVRTERNFCGIQYTACDDTGIVYSLIH